nr:hypothetical protein [Tanacetum cinerariifolium]
MTFDPKGEGFKKLHAYPLLRFFHAQPVDTYKLLRKLLEDLQITKKELAEYINSSSWNHPVFYDDDEHYIQYKEYLENYSNAIAPEEPYNSLSIGDEHLRTTLKTESDEIIKSSVENLVPIPSEFDDFFDNESECDVLVCDDFTTFSNHLFDSDDDFSSSDDESFSVEDVPKENFKIYSNPLFDNEIISSKIYPHHFNVESGLIESLLNRDIWMISNPKIDSFLEEFNGEIAHIYLVPLGINKADFDLEDEICLIEELFNSHMEEIDLFLAMNDLMPLGIENDDYDSEGDIHFLEEFLSSDPFPLPKNESFKFDHHDAPLFPRPLTEPPNVQVFLDFKPDTGVLTTKMMKGISEHYVLMPNILPTLPTFNLDLDFTPSHDFLGSENKNFDPRIFIEDKVFKPGILSYLLVSHRDKITSNFSENPMMIYGGDIPLLDVPIAPDLEASRARSFVHRPLELQSLAYGNPIS